MPEGSTQKTTESTGTQTFFNCPVDGEGGNGPRNGGKDMQVQEERVCPEGRDPEIDEELADVLMAISVVSRRLARKLAMLSRQGKQNKEGGQSDEQDK